MKITLDKKIFQRYLLNNYILIFILFILFGYRWTTNVASTAEELRNIVLGSAGLSDTRVF